MSSLLKGTDGIFFVYYSLSSQYVTAQQNQSFLLTYGKISIMSFSKITSQGMSPSIGFFLLIHLYYMIITIKLKKLLSFQIGQMNSPLLSQNQVDGQVQIKTERVLSIDFPKEVKYDNTCSICQEEIWSGKIVQFECNHIFHSQCIHQWLKTKKNACPNCRESISVSFRQSINTNFSFLHQKVNIILSS
ncbi:hypothetical protein ABPG72_012193 [Tetrahymena utriculariae]